MIEWFEGEDHSSATMRRGNRSFELYVDRSDRGAWHWMATERTVGSYKTATRQFGYAPSQLRAQARAVASLEVLAEDHSDGIMVCFFLDADTAEKLALPDGEPPEDMHVTLGYLGKTSDGLSQDDAKAVLADFAAVVEDPVEAEISGFGVFNTEDGRVLYASVDSPTIGGFRESLVENLDAEGLEVSKQHGYTPHITLKYLDPDEDLPFKELPNQKVTFSSVWLAWGEERTEYELGEGEVSDRPRSSLPEDGTEAAEDMATALALRMSRVFFADDQEVAGWANWVHQQAVQHEPDITSDVHEVAEAEGGDLYGLDFRVKSPDSLTRKIKLKVDQSVPAEEAARSIADAVRYTMVFPTEDYADAVQDAAYRLEEKGYAILSQDNAWPSGDDYSGLSFEMMTPWGVPMELQFHTPESYENKEHIHPLYEQKRDPANPLPDRQRAWDQMTKTWDSIPTPPNALEYDRLKTYPRPARRL